MYEGWGESVVGDALWLQELPYRFRFPRHPTWQWIGLYTKSLVGPPAGDTLWVQAESVTVGTPRNGLFGLWTWQWHARPHDCESTFFYKVLISPAGGALWVQRAFVRLGTPRNKLCCLCVLQQYLTRLSMGLFSKGIISPAADALWVQGSFIRRHVPRNGLCSLLTLQRYPTWLWIGLFSKDIVFPPAGDALWVQGVFIRLGTQMNGVCCVWALQQWRNPCENAVRIF